MKIDEYLEMCLKTYPIFFYSKTDDLIQMSIDKPDWGDFLVNKETM